jgi:hypothetical protein
MTIGCGGFGSGTASVASSKSFIAPNNPAAFSRELSVYDPLSTGSGRTTMLDSGTLRR